MLKFPLLYKSPCCWLESKIGTGKFCQNATLFKGKWEGKNLTDFMHAMLTPQLPKYNSNFLLLV